MVMEPHGEEQRPGSTTAFQGVCIFSTAVYTYEGLLHVTMRKGMIVCYWSKHERPKGYHG